MTETMDSAIVILLMKALITAGGKGTRMRPLTFSTNKHFIPLANKPLLFYAIEEVAIAGITEIGINYNPGQLDEIKNHLGDGKKWGVNFTYILQEAPKGLANIVEVSEAFLGKDKFLMHLGDNIFYGGIKGLVDAFDKSKLNAMASIIHHKDNCRMGVPYFDKKGKVVKFVEKPPNPPNDFGLLGLYFFDSNVFKCFKGKNRILPSARGELEIGSPYNWLIEKGFKVKVNEFKGVWLDPGKFDDWIETNQFLLDQILETVSESELSENVKVEGRVKIGKNCRIANSVVRGPVIIGDNVVINNSFIGPYSAIADDCVIKGANIENSILEKSVQIENASKTIEGSLIGESTIVRGDDEKVNLFVGNQCSLQL